MCYFWRKSKSNTFFCMADNTHTALVVLKVNNDEAKKKIQENVSALEKMRKRLDALAAIPASKRSVQEKQEYANLTKEIRKTEKELNRMQSAAQAADRVLTNISKANLKELKTTLKNINRELNSGNIERGSERWNELAKKAREVKTEIAKVNDEMKVAKRTLKPPTSFFNNIGVAWSSFHSSFFGLKDSFNSAKAFMEGFVNEYAEMAEHTSGVVKYTGLAKEEVDALNESFKQLDTRTPREKLNDLAADAGRLGIQSKEAVLDFVEAADQINVALGEDLGEDAVKNIGKLAQMFGDADRMGLKQAMLSTGSVINELAQSSSASEGYLMEFTSRLAGVGKQAGMTQADVMAFGSVLDQNMVNVEKGATALQNVITALYAKPAKLAKVAGLDVKEFTKLLKTDGNAAVLKFIEALRKAGKMDALAPMLQDMKLSGSGVTQTLSTLAANLQQVKETQQQATRAFEDGTSVTNEFNTANNTAKGELEKAQKRAKDLRVELGEKLYPVFTAMIKGGNTLLSVLMKISPWLNAHAKEITVVTAVIVTYAAVVKVAAGLKALLAAKTALATMAQKAWNASVAVGRTVMNLANGLVLSMQVGYFTLTRNLARARVAQEALNKTMIKNPYAAIAAAVIAVGGAIYLWFKRLQQLKQTQNERLAIEKDMVEMEKKGNEAVASTQSKITLLTAIVHDNNRKLADRLAAIKALKKIVPGYTAQIDKEGRVVRENTRAINDYITALKKKAIIQAAQEALVKLEAEKMNVVGSYRRRAHGMRVREKRLNDWLNASPENKRAKSTYEAKQAINMPVWNYTSKELEYGKLNDELKEMSYLTDQANKDLARINAREAELINTAKFMGVKVDEILGQVNGGGGGNGDDDGEGTGYTSVDKETGKEAKRRKEIRIKTAALEEQERKDQQKLAAKFASREIKTYYDYQQKKLEKEKEFLEKKKALYKEGDSEIATLNKQIAEVDEKLTKERTDWSLNQIDVETDAALQALSLRHEKERMSEDQYQREVEAIETQRLERRLNYLRDAKNGASPEEIYKAEEALQKQKNTAAYNEDMRFWKKVSKMRDEYLALDLEKQKAAELAFLEELHNKHDDALLSEEEYQKAKKAIEEKYKKKAEDEKNGKSDGDGKAKGDDEWKIKDPLGSSTDAWSQGVEKFARVLASLKMKLKDGEASWEDYAAVGVASIAMLSAVMDTMSQVFQVQQQEEEAKVTAKYDAEIKAAGQNSARGKQLEEKKQKDLAKIKNKYNKKMMAVEIAQAVAQTAMNALQAYGSVVKIPIVGPALAVAAAAAATAAGMIQIATIKKQHAAQSEGYYEGGFTGGNRWRRTAGVVHEGEFVANHEAVRNPNVLPVLQLIDHAQRTNRIAQLTATDVSRAIAAPLATSANTAATASVAALQVADGGANGATNEVLTKLTEQIDQGIKAVVVIDGPEGLARQWTLYNKMNKQ